MKSKIYWNRVQSLAKLILVGKQLWANVWIKHITTVVLSFLLALPTYQVLIQPGYFPMHDDQQVVRLHLLDQALTSGQFPVHWVDGLGFGFGYPLFIFYPPLIYYLGEAIHVLTQISFVASVKVIFGLSLPLSVISMYYWLRQTWGRIPAWVGALAYLYLPYRAVDVYVRGAMAEAFAFVWLPLVLLGVDKLWQFTRERNSIRLLKTHWREAVWYFVLMSVPASLLIVTHPLIALPMAGLSLLYYLIRGLSLDRKSISVYLSMGILAAGLGLVSSAWFWWPSLAEKQHTLVDSILLEDKYDYALHFVEPTQLWNSLWGYGGSTAGVLDGFSLKIGKVVLVSYLVLTLVMLGYFVNKKLKSWLKLDVNQANQTLAVITLFGLSAWLTTDWSKFVWDGLPPLQYLQFPWRFLSFTALFGAAVTAIATVCLGRIWPKLLEEYYQRVPITNSLIKSRIFAWILGRLMPITTLIVGLILVIGLYLPHAKLFKPEIWLEQASDETILTTENISWHISSTSFEFVPKDVATRFDQEKEITQLAINRSDVPDQIYQLGHAEADAKVIADLPGYKHIKLDTDQISDVVFNTFYFPGWKLYLNGQEQPIIPMPPLQLISTVVDAGSHDLIIQFEATPVRAFSLALSGFSWMTIFILLAIARFKVGS